jgi:hypothetical protein
MGLITAWKWLFGGRTQPEPKYRRSTRVGTARAKSRLELQPIRSLVGRTARLQGQNGEPSSFFATWAWALTPRWLKRGEYAARFGPGRFKGSVRACEFYAHSTTFGQTIGRTIPTACEAVFGPNASTLSIDRGNDEAREHHCYKQKVEPHRHRSSAA